MEKGAHGVPNFFDKLAGAGVRNPSGNLDLTYDRTLSPLTQLAGRLPLRARPTRAAAHARICFVSAPLTFQ